MSVHLGIDLDGLLPQIVILDEAGLGRQARTMGDVPPSIALGRLPGERPRLDVQLPIDSRGSGLDLAENMLVEGSAYSMARFPIAYAWEMLARATNNARIPSWNWCHDGNVAGSITPGRALAVAMRDLVASVSPHDSMTRSPAQPSQTLVVPDDMDESQQDHLLRWLRLEAGQTRLLWRPVAATLAWIEHYARDLYGSADHLESIGRVLHLHLGAESWDAALLDVVNFVAEDGTRWLLPGRFLPENGYSTSLKGWTSRCLEEVATRTLQDAGVVKDAQRWNLLWGTSWCHASLLGGQATGGAAVASLPPWIPPHLVARSRHQLARTLLAGIQRDVPGSGWNSVERLVGPRTFPNKRTWLAELGKLVTASRLLGAVVTGPFATFPVSVEGALGDILVRSIATIPPKMVLSEGASPTSRGLLSGGAATFGVRTALRQPTYLDTLPSVRMIAMVNCEPEWVSLIETSNRWVMGSDTWTKEPEKTRFNIAKGERELHVSVHRDGAPTCRIVRTQFDTPAEATSSVRLRVSITPGQGAPRVEIRPTNDTILRGRCLTFDWMNAEETDRSPIEELESADRACPAHEPRLASHSKWAERGFNLLSGARGVQGLIQMFVDGKSTIVTNDGQTRPLLRWIRHLLREWDRNANLGWATAVSSDCTLQTSSPTQHDLLRRFVTRLDELILATDEMQHEALKTMAAMSALGPNMDDILDRFLNDRIVSDDDGLWWAAGHCLREPDEIRRLIELASVTPSTSSFKQVARALMFRRDALAGTPPKLAGRMLILAARQAQSLAIDGKFQIAFQEAALLCAYLLRERIYYQDFASEGSTEQKALRDAFECAQKRIDAGATVMGGVIDKSQLVKEILDYVDRKGRGRLVVYAQD